MRTAAASAVSGLTRLGVVCGRSYSVRDQVIDGGPRTKDLAFTSNGCGRLLGLKSRRVGGWYALICFCGRQPTQGGIHDNQQITAATNAFRELE